MRAFYSSITRIMQLAFVCLALLVIWGMLHSAGASPAQVGQAIGSFLSSAFSLLDNLFYMLENVLGGLL
jgi:ABC-type nitrate/sulfonate/bicarbonate transport system permease component